MKLSIIICLYNTDKNLFAECLRSITESTLKQDEYEILVIDDGSDKDYSDLLKEYSPRVIRTENRGIFKARLLGIKEALGDYIAFVDSDDSVSFNYHSPMVKHAASNDCDIVFNDWAFHTERTKYCCMADSTLSGNFSVCQDEVLLMFAKQSGREHAYFVLWNKVFKSSILKKALDDLLPISEKYDRYNYSEDALICFFAFKYATSSSNVHTGYYFYRKHSSQSINISSEASLKSKITYMSATLDTMLSSIGDNIYKSELENCIKKWQSLMARAHFSHAKANKYLHLYDYLKERYHTNTLRISTFKDTSAYSKNKILPYNFTDIDNALLSIFNGKSITRSDKNNNYDYVRKSLESIKEDTGELKLSASEAVIPKAKYSFKNRIIMNRFVYTIGLLLFKKGSKIREFLKVNI